MGAGPSLGLGFDELPGALVAVCGLAGGAGTTTLAYLLAAHAARESSGPVLLCEAEASLGGLATMAGRTSSHGLGGLADLESGGAPLDELPYAELGRGLRLLAAPPRPCPVVGDASLRSVLDRARSTHPLVVVDCRTVDHPHAAALLAGASHVLWTLPMTEMAIRSAEMLTAYGSLPLARAAHEALVAVGTRAPTPSVTVRDLRALADGRHERLILIPHTAELQEMPQVSESEAIRSALTQVGTLLRRSA
jgi:hypothetical protein